MSEDWPEVDLKTVERAFKGRRAVYEEIAKWVAKGWRVREQGHKFALYPPKTGVRLVPPWVRIDGTPKADPTWQARMIKNECRKLEQQIEEASKQSLTCYVSS